MKTVFRIQAPDGTFLQNNKYRTVFGTRARNFSSASALSNHLISSDVTTYRKLGCKVVELQLIEAPVQEASVDEWLEGVDERREKRNKAKDKRRAERELVMKQQQITALEQQLARLRK